MNSMTETLTGTAPVSDNGDLKQHLTAPLQEGQTLRDSVEKALRNYFAHLDGQPVTDVYNMVLCEVKPPARKRDELRQGQPDQGIGDARAQSRHLAQEAQGNTTCSDPPHRRRPRGLDRRSLSS